MFLCSAVRWKGGGEELIIIPTRVYTENPAAYEWFEFTTFYTGRLVVSARPCRNCNYYNTISSSDDRRRARVRTRYVVMIIVYRDRASGDRRDGFSWISFDYSSSFHSPRPSWFFCPCRRNKANVRRQTLTETSNAKNDRDRIHVVLVEMNRSYK